MATTIGSGDRSVEIESAGGRRFRPVVAWAVAGVAFLAVQITAYAGWLTSGDAKPVPRGTDSVPTYMVATNLIIQAVAVPTAITFIYLWVIRPWRRHGRIELKGWLLIAGCTLCWQDLAANWFAPVMRYNSVYVNLGSWYSHIPGWFSPNGNMQPQPLLGVVPYYFCEIVAPVVLFSFVILKARNRWPQLSRASLIAITYGCALVATIILEWGLWVGLAGGYTYAGTVGWLTLFRGHYYQYPVYQMLLWPAVWTAWTWIYYYKGDNGMTVVESGIDRIPTGPKSKRAIRLLALIGFLNTTMFAWNITIGLISLYQDPWPADITHRSYFVEGFCGPHTDYPSCPPFSFPRK